MFYTIYGFEIDLFPIFNVIIIVLVLLVNTYTVHFINMFLKEHKNDNTIYQKIGKFVYVSLLILFGSGISIMIISFKFLMLRLIV